MFDYKLNNNFIYAVKSIKIQEVNQHNDSGARVRKRSV